MISRRLTGGRGVLAIGAKNEIATFDGVLGTIDDIGDFPGFCGSGNIVVIIIEIIDFVDECAKISVFFIKR